MSLSEKEKRPQCLRTGLLSVLLWTPCKWLTSLTKFNSNYTNKITILLHILGKEKGDFVRRGTVKKCV